ncbi:regulatory protein Ral2, partial [Trichophyton equinum CBS 127.97]
MASIRRPSSKGGDSAGNQTTITGSSLPMHSHSQSQSQSQPQQQQQQQTQNGASATAGPTNLSGLVCNVHRTSGREPHALVGATTTILGDKLYVFGGRLLSRARPELTSDLYELDLIKRHWTKIHPTGDVPPPRYFHSMCPLGDTKLVCYGGMSPRSAVAGHPPTNVSSSHSAGQEAQPEVVVMSDVHIYDVVTRTWTHINTANTPQGRYAHCATILPSSAPFVSANAPMTAIHNNPSTSTSNPHQGSIGVEIDGYGGAEMVVVGGQDSSNHYIEQISVFNLRSLKWTATSPLGRSCGAYRSVVVPLAGMSVNDLGAERTDKDMANVSNNHDAAGMPGSSMLIYSNYNFLDVKLELQARLPDGKLVEKAMDTSVSPPGLRFPNGGVINGHFV